MKSDQPSMSRLRWHCRRGMLELDLLLLGFVEAGGYALLDEGEQGLFRQLLELPDQELFDNLLATKEPENKELSRVIAKIRHAATTQN